MINNQPKPELTAKQCYTPFTHGSLFSGIGGFDLAAEWMGWQNAFHCEWNKFGQKLLKHYWPNAESFEDITKTDFTKYANKIDIITGGFPCQPYSHAGKRKGKEDERHLWPEMLRAICEIQPSYIVGENVYGLVNWNGGLVFHEVQTDLENEGYEVQPVILPACAVGAPHRRERIWFVAYSNKCTAGPSTTGKRAFGSGSNNNDEPQEWRKQTEQHNGRNNVLRTITNAGLLGQTERQEQTMGVDELCKEWNVTDPERRRQQERWGLSAPNFRNHYFQTGEPQVEPTLCRGDDGLSDWVDRIKALGNAIVPQVAFEIFKAINMHEASLSGV